VTLRCLKGSNPTPYTNISKTYEGRSGDGFVLLVSTASAHFFERYHRKSGTGDFLVSLSLTAQIKPERSSAKPMY
jgi:hypothetical protein